MGFCKANPADPLKVDDRAAFRDRRILDYQSWASGKSWGTDPDTLPGYYASSFFRSQQTPTSYFVLCTSHDGAVSALRMSRQLCLTFWFRGREYHSLCARLMHAAMESENQRHWKCSSLPSARSVTSLLRKFVSYLTLLYASDVLCFSYQALDSTLAPIHASLGSS